MDKNILFGLSKTLNEGKVDLVQFEYNARWIKNKSFLYEVFDLIKNKNYIIGKIINRRFVVFQEWHFELEKFSECDYILIKLTSCFLKFCDFKKYDYRNVLVDDVFKGQKK